ncbi:MAG: protein translocase subunit SecD [Bryobacterales bacterium]|nr:protein translocase subunit SecD [Bryobacterales bacterium]
MKRSLQNRAVIIIAVTLLAIYGIIGLPKSPAELFANMQHNIRLGLDLKGGSHLVLQVQVQDAVKSEADQVIQRLREDLAKQNIKYASIDRNDPTTIAGADDVTITVKGIELNDAGNFRDLVGRNFPTWDMKSVSSSDYALQMKRTELLALKSDTVERSLRTIEQRVNGLGLSEPIIQQHGRADAEYEILVQLPGVDDPARVKKIIGTAAVLEITDVKDGPFPSRQQALAQHGGILPLGTKLVQERPSSGSARDKGSAFYLVSRVPVVTGRDLRNARSARDEFGRWETSFTLTQDSASRFGRFTEANINNRLAVILDNQIVNVATIQSRIDDSGRITGLSGEQEASDLSLVLRAGSLPAGITYLEERTVGPSLGADSIRSGIIAALAGLAMVVIAMVVYYKRAGINATVVLLLNAIILLAILAYFGAVLTLPGIAGVILTIGMAVDSNVLIFERIREEIREGKSISAAIDIGFKKAFITIVDTHVTTVISCAFLFMFGTGPVKGFAVSLVIGLVANLFTAVSVSRWLFDLRLFRNRNLATLSI